MQKIPKEQLRKRFQILADTLQDVIFSENASASIRKAAVLGDVEGKVTILAEMTGLVLMGFLNPADFQAELQRELGVTADIARQIESSLNAEVFSLVQTELKKLYPPTIKTPTVISPSFAPKGTMGDTTPQLGESASKLEAVQPSISEFEKRFFKPAIPATGELKKTIPVPEDFLKAKVPPIAPLSKELPKVQIPTKPATPIPTPIPTIPEASASARQPADFGETKPKIKPVVPLPTYIQSQFQRRSSYAEATADKEPTESQYREKMEEKTPSTQSKPQPKISGNIIDLRNVNK